jgi:hypothetical protein
MNPITQRVNTPLQSNGAALPAKSSAQKGSTPQDINSLTQLLGERQNHALAAVFVRPDFPG